MAEDSKPEEPRTLTILLDRARAGDEVSEHQFCDLVYDELKEIAHRLVRRRSGDSIDSTMLVNQLFVEFFEKGTLARMHNRKYFFSVAIDQMRKMLIDHYRRRSSQKRGGKMQAVPLDQALDHIASEFERTHRFDFEALEKALESLKDRNPRQYEVIKYRFFGGLSVAQTAELLGVSVGSVERDWRLARTKLFAELRDADEA